MNLYLISQNVNGGYDTYDSAVVAAKSVDDARTIHPTEYETHVINGKIEWKGGGGENWVKYSDINLVEVELIGTTNMERGVILASFNAG